MLRRTLAPIVLLLISFAVCFGQSEKATLDETLIRPRQFSPSPTPQLSEKELKKQREREEKERLRRPAQIEIRAAAARVRSEVIRAMPRDYRLTDDSQNRLVFQQEITGLSGSLAQAMLGSAGPPIRTVSFTISERDGVTLVVVDLAILFPRRSNGYDRGDKNKDKKSRSWIDRALAHVKSESERPG